MDTQANAGGVPPKDERSEDTFLWAHQVEEPHVFDIATGLRPASVRDQITRARLLIRRAWEKGIIDIDTPPIVIAGGGAAGVTAALEAVNRGVHVVLVEKEPFLFGLQRFCVTRSLDPNLYDWPGGDWDSTSYPLRGDRVDLTFRMHELPRRIAQRWAAAVREKAAQHQELLQLRHEMTIRTVDQVGERTHYVTFNTVASDGSRHPAPTSADVTASMVIYAQGPGIEHDTLRDKKHAPLFHGYRFWDTDPFLHLSIQRSRRGKRAPHRAPKRVLIAGSGDGALQDLLRLIIRPAAGLRTLLGDCAIPPEHRTMVETSLLHNTASFLWCANRFHEHECDRYAHEEHTSVINDLFATRATRKQILKAVSRCLRDTIPEIVFMPGCDHFTHSYPANRFTALLVMRALELLGKHVVTMRTNTLLTSITCAHDVPPQASSALSLRRAPRLRKYCYAQPHTITYAPGVCHEKAPTFSSTDPEDAFDTIILRVGIDEKSTAVPFVRNHEKPLRQLLPLHLAHQS